MKCSNNQPVRPSVTRRFATGAKAVAIVGAAALTLSACGTSSSSKASTTSTSTGPTAGAATIVIGNFNPFSGADASFGPEMVAGCQPAARLINADGGVFGHRFSCVEFDTRGDPADAVPAANKMIATNSSLGGILGPSADEALATVPILNQAKVPMFVDTGQAFFDKSSYKYVWRLTPGDDVKGYALALWAKKEGYTRAAAIFGNDAGSQSDVPTLLAAWKKLGGKMVDNVKLALDQSSYRTEIEQMLSSKPQVIFTEIDPQTAGTFLSELQQLHGLIPVLGTEITLQSPWLKAVTGAIGKEAMTKYITGMQPYAPTSGPSWTTYNSALLASKSQVPQPAQWSSDPYSMTYYDGVTIMALAMLAAKSTDRAVYNKSITAVTEPGPGKTVVHSFAQGKSALANGEKIQFVGAGGPVAFNRWHNSSGAFEAAQQVNGTVKIVGEVTSNQIAALSK
jgi:ABC-type branched-subunit amino acid transport system substrate-binding protein